MINIFVGQDPRESIGLSVFCHSVWSRASEPVSITPLSGRTDGTNAFTLARFLVPHLCDYHGWAIWADGSDMLCLADIKELWNLRDSFKALQVVKHDYKTLYPTKYLGQKNYDYPRKNWSSLMLINCAHYSWRMINPENIEEMSGTELHRFSFIKDEQIGALPLEWNVIVGEPNQSQNPKIAHFSIGLPVWYPRCAYAGEWNAEANSMNYFEPWSPD